MGCKSTSILWGSLGEGLWPHPQGLAYSFSCTHHGDNSILTATTLKMTYKEGRAQQFLKARIVDHVHAGEGLVVTVSITSNCLLFRSPPGLVSAFRAIPRACTWREPFGGHRRQRFQGGLGTGCDGHEHVTHRAPATRPDAQPGLSRDLGNHLLR